MKTRQIISIIGLLSLLGSGTVAVAQGTAFTYQGRLEAGGAPYTGNAEFQPTLWNAASGGSQIAANTPTQVAVGVTNGLFVLPLDFGANFPGADRWLQLQVRTNIGSGPFTTLLPRQKLTPAPYAITASNLSGTLPAAQLSGTVPSANLGGTYSGTLTFNNAANSFSGNGAGLTALNASQLTSGTVPDARLSANVARTNQVWLLSGNAGTTAGTHFLGTTDNQSLELKVNRQRALRLEPHTNSPNVIAGHPGNFLAAGVFGSAIGGGGMAGYTNAIFASVATIAGGYNNTIQDYSHSSTIGGGYRNTIQSDATGATIGGGEQNTIETEADQAAIGGGWGNAIRAFADRSTIGGGGDNTIQNNASYSTIGGGNWNSVQPKANYSTIAGGSFNLLGTNCDYSAIGGGSGNTIQPNAAAATVGGGSENTIGTNSDGATIGGGVANVIMPEAYKATIGGGLTNVIEESAWTATISGGYWNRIGPGATHATIGGGRVNEVQSAANYAAIVGGFRNIIQTSANFGFIGGGEYNTIEPSRQYATIGGGLSNKICGGYEGMYVYNSYATIPGGRDNCATNYAFAAGRRAKAIHTGSFVWADSTDADFATTGTNQFLIRASGGVGIGGPPTNALLDVKGDVRLNDKDLRLRGGTDTYQGLGWYGSGKTFAGLTPDGPVLYGWAGGVLGTHRGGARAVLQWDDGKVGIGRTPTANALEVEGNASKTTAGSWLANSDARIKTDVATLTNALGTLKKVRLVRFRYTEAYRAAHPSAEDRPYLNVVAQEFAEVFPDAVTSSGEKLPDGSEILQVDLHPLIIYSAAAVQELSRQLDDERMANAALRQRIARLENIIEQLAK